MTHSRIVETVRDGIDRGAGVREGLNRLPVVSPTPHPSHDDTIVLTIGGTKSGMSYAALRLKYAYEAMP